MLDSHSYSPDENHYEGYDWIKPDQISWFREEVSTRRRSSAHKDYTHIHLDMAFIHIPLPEIADKRLLVEGSGEFREPSTAPRFNSGFKDVLIEEGIFAVSFGHDHVNDHCALADHSDPSKIDTSELDMTEQKHAKNGKLWMCYAGGSGLGGYGGHGGYRRRLRIWDLDTNVARVETWKRVVGSIEKVDFKVVAENGGVRES